MAITGGVYERRIKDGLLVNLQSIYNMTQQHPTQFPEIWALNGGE